LPALWQRLIGLGSLNCFISDFYAFTKNKLYNKLAIFTKKTNPYYFREHLDPKPTNKPALPDTNKALDNGS
jgi:hypothetical protein